jgi:type IV pilus assembly protein PilA
MLQKLRARSQSESGFTLVELLVVMLILGLLAAIAIPSFFNQRDKARDSDAKSSVRTAQTAIETYATDHGGSYNGAAPGDLTTIEPTLNDAPGTITVTSDDTTYTVTVASANEPNTFSISRDENAQTTYTCTDAGNDGCPDVNGSGNWSGDA